MCSPSSSRTCCRAGTPIRASWWGEVLAIGRARGFDATFSAPKSVSLLWALSPDPWVRAEVLAAHDTAVVAALGWFAQHGAHTRRGADGAHQVDTRGVVAGLFRQHTSRTVDPQLHTHAVIWSKVQDPTGKWLALDARFLKRQQRSIGWIYDAALRTELTARLGVDWDPIEPGAGQADLIGVPSWLRDRFSERSEQVAAKLAELVHRWVDEHDGADPDARSLHVLERRAVVASRPDKQHGVDAAELHREWRERAVEVGFEPDRIPGGQRHLAGTSGWDPEVVIDAAIDQVTEQRSTWLRADLAREIATLVPAECAENATGLVGLVDDLAAEAEARCQDLHPPAAPGTPRRADGSAVTEHVTDRQLTTDAVLEQERRLLSWAKSAIHPQPPIAGPAVDPQHTAAAAVAGKNELVLVVGPAGTGKTTTLARAVDSLVSSSRSVIGLAPSGKAADVLAGEAGCPTSTLAKLLHEHRSRAGPSPHWRLPIGTTLILDEAGMARTADLDQLVDLARRHGWRLVCVGDPEQLPAVGRGGMFAHWCDTLPAHRLDQVHRFTEDWQAGASLLLRRGDPRAAVGYAGHNRLHSVHPALVADRIARQHQAVTNRDETVAITTSSAATARAINIEIQRRAGSAHGRAADLADGTRARVGDQVVTRRNDTTLTTSSGAAVRNRHAWTVARVHRHGDLTVTDPDRGTVRLPAGYARRHVELGWAVTGYGSQGTTTDHGICVIEPTSSRAGIYVGMTRGRGHNIAWILDPTGLDDPTDAFAEAVARPANALTAHAVRDQLADKGPPATLESDANRTRRQLDQLASSAPGLSR